MKFATTPLRLTCCLLTASLLSACVNYSGIGSDQKMRSVDTFASSESLRAQAGDWPTQNWWEAFHDPQLDALVTEALAHNPSLAEAAARVAGASASLQATSAGRLPMAEAFGQVTAQRYTENGFYPSDVAGSFQSSGDLGVRANYELDFWGRNRALVAAAQSQQAAAGAELASTRLLLAHAVVKAYFELAQWQSFRAIGEHALTQREHTLALTRQRVDAGLDTQAELKQAEMQVPLTKAILAQLDESIVHSQHALAALLGAGPDRGLGIIATPPAGESEIIARVPDNLPVELLGHRPDIVAARWRVEAALQRTSARKAAFYPNINLAAFAGLSSIGLGNLLDSKSVVYGASPALSLPLFDGDRLRGELKSDYAAYDGAVANYNQTLVAALRDVADQLNSYRALAPQIREQHAALVAVEGALDLAQQRYRAGLGNYLTVLNAEGSVFMQQIYATQLQIRAHSLRADMARAFGGGYIDPAIPAVATAHLSGESHE